MLIKRYQLECIGPFLFVFFNILVIFSSGDEFNKHGDNVKESVFFVYSGWLRTFDVNKCKDRANLD